MLIVVLSPLLLGAAFVMSTDLSSPWAGDAAPLWSETTLLVASLISAAVLGLLLGLLVNRWWAPPLSGGTVVVTAWVVAFGVFEYRTARYGYTDDLGPALMLYFGSLGGLMLAGAMILGVSLRRFRLPFR